MDSSSARALRLLQALSRGAMCGLFCLLPLFVLPWTLDPFETAKYLLFVVLMSVALLGWLGSMVFSRRFAFRTSWMHVIPAGFLLVVTASTIFSFGAYQSWIGGASQEYTSALAILMLVLLYALNMNVAGESSMQKKLLVALLWSAAISGLVTLLGMLNIVHLPFAFSQARSFTTVGPLNAYAIFMITVMFLGHALWLVLPRVEGKPLFEGKQGMMLRVLISIVTLTTLFTLVAIDFWVLWALSILGVLLLIAFGFIQTKEFPEPRRFVLPFLVLVFSVLFLFFRTPLNVGVPTLVSLNYETSWNIAKDAMGQSTTRLLVGTGPGTFIYDYGLFKPVEVNQTIFWNVLFDRAKSHVLTSLATFGILGTMLWVLFVLLLGLRALGRLVLERDHEEWKMTYVIFVGWSLIVSAHVLYSSNLTLQVLFWGLSGMLAGQVFSRWREADFGRSPRMGLATSFAFVLLSVVMMGSVFLAGQYYAAEAAFAKAVALDRGDATVQEINEQVLKTIQINPLMDSYYRSLSSGLLARAAEVILEGGEEPSQEQLQQIQSLVAGAVNSAVRATQYGPFNVANWSVRGQVYRDVMGFAQDAEDFAAATFTQATQLEPVNPVHYTDLGRVHLVVAERARSLKSSEDAELAKTAGDAEVTQLDLAAEAFEKAIELKPDYAPAHYYLAAVFERQGNLDDATARLEALTRAKPLDVGLGLQLSLLYMREEEWADAEAELERIVGIAPEYSNALWYLSAVYERRGDDTLALQAAEKVLELNPDNEAVKQRVEALKGGSAPSEELPPPVEEGDDEVTE